MGKRKVKTVCLKRARKRRGLRRRKKALDIRMRGLFAAYPSLQLAVKLESTVISAWLRKNLVDGAPPFTRM
jgi:hypothetical protein